MTLSIRRTNEKGRNIIWFSVDCGYWTDNWNALKKNDQGEAICPDCGAKGHTDTEEAWLDLAKQAAQFFPGYESHFQEAKQRCRRGDPFWEQAEEIVERGESPWTPEQQARMILAQVHAKKEEAIWQGTCCGFWTDEFEQLVSPQGLVCPHCHQPGRLVTKASWLEHNRKVANTSLIVNTPEEHLAFVQSIKNQCFAESQELKVVKTIRALGISAKDVAEILRALKNRREG